MNPLLKSVLPTDRLPHIWQVIATLLAVASTFVLCWYLSQKGLLDLAATGVSFYAITFLRQLAPSLSGKAPREFKKTAGLIDTARADFAEWMANRKMLSLAIIALIATIAFLTFRYIASILMVAIASPWLALAVGLALAAAVASPVMIKGIITSFTKRNETKPEDRDEKSTEDKAPEYRINENTAERGHTSFGKDAELAEHPRQPYKRNDLSTEPAWHSDTRGGRR